MPRLLFLLTLFVATAGAAAAQGNAIFLSQGKIEFERSINAYARLNKQDNGEWTELEKKMTSHFKLAYFDLLFTRDKSLYRPGREGNDIGNGFFNSMPAQNNTVYSDLSAEKGITQRNVFEDIFLVQDSLRKINWKITTETRTIAGFSCRRANAIIMDSVYVVAFYTDEILTPGGPESFTGLPGMILGVAIPHDHVSWFATKVEAVTVTDSQLTPPVKGKKTDKATLIQTLRQHFGGGGDQFMHAALL